MDSDADLVAAFRRAFLHGGSPGADSQALMRQLLSPGSYVPVAMPPYGEQLFSHAAPQTGAHPCQRTAWEADAPAAEKPPKRAAPKPKRRVRSNPAQLLPAAPAAASSAPAAPFATPTPCIPVGSFDEESHTSPAAPAPALATPTAAPALATPTREREPRELGDRSADAAVSRGVDGADATNASAALADVEAASPPLQKGAACVVTSGEHAGCTGVVKAIDGDGDVYVRLDPESSGRGGSSVVLPRALLRHVLRRAAPVAHVDSTPSEVPPSPPEKAEDAEGGEGADAHAAPAAPLIATAEEETCAAAGAAVGGPAVDACLAVLSEWPEGAHAVAMGMMVEEDEAAATATRELARGLDHCLSLGAS